MKQSVLIAEPARFSPQAKQILAAGADVVMSDATRTDLAKAFAEHDVVWVRLAQRIDAATLGANPRCRVLACPATGLDHIDLDACASRGIRVVSLKGETAFLQNVRATAELSVGLILALARHIPRAARHVVEGGWDRDRFQGHELYERTAGIVGVGRLGTLVAGYLRAFGMRVIGYDPRPDFPVGVAERCATLDELLAQSDVVSLHVSYSDETRHLIDERALSLVKRGAILVNTSRGGVVDEDALLAALRDGRLAGAALDVLEGEPDIGAKHHMVKAARKIDNLIVVPHIGGNTVESWEKVEVFVARRVVATLADIAGQAA